MSTLEILAMLIIVVVILVWRITWLASRVHRATMRTERSWSALNAALVGRARRAAELVMMPGIDPATALLVLDAAAAALEPDLCQGDRERAESDLSHVLDAVDPMLPASPRELASERARASICRRLHNDAVATALFLRRRFTVRILRLAGGTAEPRPFEMADGLTCTLTAGPPDSLPSSLAYVRAAVHAGEPRAPEVGEAG
ncbi:MAG TPA: hypothetical protein VF086_08150 [Propionibacteriaceae bacterium]